MITITAASRIDGMRKKEGRLVEGNSFFGAAPTPIDAIGDNGNLRSLSKQRFCGQRGFGLPCLFFSKIPRHNTNVSQRDERFHLRLEPVYSSIK